MPSPTIVSTSNLSASLNPLPTTHLPSLVDKIRRSEDKSLSRLAPVTIAESGRPRVQIPDSIFQIGAELHKDFIICYFNGRSPPYNQIQSVLNHMWGKGKRVEIHNNPLSHSMLVRIPSDYLRQKILEKSVWYVGDSMFHAVQWTSSTSFSSPPLESIQIWAHLHGVPLDLRHTKGLSLVAGLVGDPKETDDFTKNLVSLTLSHVKVAVDLTKPMPSVVEFERDSGEVVEVMVTYPWLPPTCSHCKELGHIVRNCLHLPPQSKQPSKTPQKSGKLAPPRQSPSKQSANLHLASSQKSHISPPPAAIASSSPLVPMDVEVTVAQSSQTISPSLPVPISTVHPKPMLPTPASANPFKFASPLSTSKHPSTFKRPPPHSNNSHKPKLHLSAHSSLPFTKISSKNQSSSSPDSDPKPSLKRSRSNPGIQDFPSFTAQLSFFTSASLKTSSHSEPHSPSSSINSFDSLVTDGLLLPEEANKKSQ